VLRVKLSKEASNYFFDNGDLVLDLRMAVEGLIFTNGIPTQGLHQVDQNGIHGWEIMNHSVIYKIEGSLLIVIVVMPVV
jgi:hypothetical protein